MEEKNTLPDDPAALLKLSMAKEIKVFQPRSLGFYYFSIADSGTKVNYAKPRFTLQASKRCHKHCVLIAENLAKHPKYQYYVTQSATPNRVVERCSIT